MFKIGASLHPRRPLWSVHHQYPHLDENHKTNVMLIIYLTSKGKYLETENYVAKKINRYNTSSKRVELLNNKLSIDLDFRIV